MWVRSIPAVVTTVIRPVKPGSRLVRSSTLTPQTSSLDAGKRDFSVSFSWLCSLPLFVFCLQHCFFFCSHNLFFYDNVETQKYFKWDSADILLCFNVFFSAFVVKFSTCFPSFLYQFSCDLFLVIAICFFLLFRFLITFRKRLDNFHYYTEWN